MWEEASKFSLGVLLLFSSLLCLYQWQLRASVARERSRYLTVSPAVVPNTPLMSSEKLTIRVNTFRRNDMLKVFLSSFHKCPIVEEIQVVWSDLKNSPPSFIGEYDRTVVEVHKNNSLSNRFIALLPIKTNAVFSVDDDIVTSCSDLDFLAHTWTMNRRTLVGISPRLVTYHPETGLARYRNWQVTWWNGMYSVMLTKAAVLDKSFLYSYRDVIPQDFLTFIDEHRNCEDLAMAYLVSLKSEVPPVWTKVIFYDVGQGGISSGTSHYDIRSECLQRLEQLSGHHKPWQIGRQKIVQLDWLNTVSLLWKDQPNR